MSKKNKKAEKETAAPSSSAAAASTEHAMSKKERKALKKAAEKAAEEAAAQARKEAERAEKAARKAAKAAAKSDASAETPAAPKGKKSKKAKKAKSSAKSAKAAKPEASADTAPAAPRFKHLRKKKLTSGKGASPREVGESLVALFNAGKADEAERTWYHRKIESIEADGSVFEGVKGVAEKSAWWTSENTIVAAKAEGPFVCSTGFTVLFTMTVEKKDGTRHEFREAGFYTVEGGRVVREQFMF
jgi:hypothetical protein